MYNYDFFFSIPDAVIIAVIIYIYFMFFDAAISRK